MDGCILDEKVDQKVCEYLREHHVEYQNTKQKMKDLVEQYPKVQAVFETDDEVTLTAEEHEILHTEGQGTDLCPDLTGSVGSVTHRRTTGTGSVTHRGNS